MLFVLNKILESEKGIVHEIALFQEALYETKVTSLSQFQANLSEAINHKLLIRQSLDMNQGAYKSKYSKNDLASILSFYQNNKDNLDVSIDSNH